jgi:hypothetical protein
MALSKDKTRFNLSISKELLETLKTLAILDDDRSCNSLIIKLINRGLESEEMQPLLEKFEQTKSTEK